MGILNDKQIKKLSTPPKYIIEREVAIIKHNDDGSAYRDSVITKEYSDYDFADERKANEYIEKYQNTQKGIMVAVRNLTDSEILSTRPLIYPFYNEVVNEKLNLATGKLEKIIPYGMDSFVYNVRLANMFLIYKNSLTDYADPKRYNEDDFESYTGNVCVIPKDCYVVAQTVENFSIPSSITGIVSTSKMVSRAGISCMTGFVESNHTGPLMLEFMNNTSVPGLLYAGEGAAQIMFFRSDVTRK